MHYRDLIQFEPIETVVQLKSADQQQKAYELVQSYVISDRISEQLTEIILPQLQYDEPLDNKGMLIVGNYGTGKSHLMSLISSVAEYPEVIPAIKNAAVAGKATEIAGKFKVIRTELGGSGMTLRAIVLGSIQDQLKQWKINYKFLPVDQVPNNKDPMVEMMNTFHEVFPDHGLLLVVDELLDYLRGRKEQELIMDLNFLREIGEVCGLTRFRFLAGVQEALFESPRFQFAADTLRRVKDRFHQVRIVKQDVAFVVSQRILRKTDQQKAKIQEHLQKFTTLYDHMTERMDEFVDLFPIHPAYLDAFEQMSIAENREILKTTSGAIKKLVDNELPSEEPGLLTYDHYWDVMQANASLRSIPEVREVMDKSKILEDRVKQALTIPSYRPAALRIIRALSVHRLTTDDIYTPLGLTAEELRDDLCLYLPIPEQDSDFLKTSIESVLKEITKTVSSQFISSNPENGQYYLDLKKDIDYDALIEQKAETLSDSQLDRYYFDILLSAMECPLTTYVRDFKIWEHQLEWRERKTMRRGYLFFGAPNERSTAQPPRDFYLFFLQPLEAPLFTDEKKADEVFFKLIQRDEEFSSALRYLAASRELASIATRGTRRVYDEKAEGYSGTLTNWLRDNISTAYDVTYRGVTKKLGEWLRGQAKHDSFRDQVNLVASISLAPHFQDQAPEYPTFANLITHDSGQQAMQDAIKWILGQIKPRQGANILTALELLDGERIDPSQSRYAKHIMQQLKQKGTGQVLNREELITKHYDGVEYEPKFRLEPELLVVVLASLVYSGDIIMTVSGLKIDAGNIDELGRMPAQSLINFSSIEPPKDVPIAELKTLFGLLDLTTGLIVDVTNREEAVRRLQGKLNAQIQKVLLTREKLNQGLSFLGQALLDEQEKAHYQTALDSLNSFLQPLAHFDKPAKLRNFKTSKEEIAEQRPYLDALEKLDKLLDLLNATSPLTTYLIKAESALLQDNKWVLEARAQRDELVMKIKEASNPSKLLPEIKSSLEQLKNSYIDVYYAAHQKARLNSFGEGKKKELRGDPRLAKLNQLRNLDWLQSKDLDELQAKFDQLKVCDRLTKSNLKDAAVCPHCYFKPIEEQIRIDVKVTLDQIELDLEKLNNKWTADLIQSLEDPSTKEDFSLLPPEQQDKLQKIISTGELPQILDSSILESIKDVLSGLEPLTVATEKLQEALGGAPCSKEEFKRRFDEYLDSLMQGRDQSKVRIIVE